MTRQYVLRGAAALLAIGLMGPLSAQGHARDGEIHDADTKAWWHTTEVLSSDAMEGRDTGSAAYQRAAEYVAGRFQQAGLKPAGENGGYFQTVPMHEVAVQREGTSFTAALDGGGSPELRFLEDITIVPAAGLPTTLEARMTFRGYCGKEAMGDVRGKIVVCFGRSGRGFRGVRRG
jgi:hypothetical protein